MITNQNQSISQLEPDPSAVTTVVWSPVPLSNAEYLLIKKHNDESRLRGKKLVLPSKR